MNDEETAKHTATPETEVRSECTHEALSKDNGKKTKPAPKWEGATTKIEYLGRTQVTKDDLPFFIFFGSTILKRDFFIFISLGFATLLMASVPTIIWMIETREARIAAYHEDSSRTEDEHIEHHRPLPHQTNIHNIMEWHIEASKSHQIKSYQLHGTATILDNHSEVKISLLGIPPNHYRQDSWPEWKSRVSTRFNMGGVTCGITSGYNKYSTVQLNKLDKAMLWMESSLGYLAQVYLNEKQAINENNFDFSKLRFIKISDREGKRFSVIESQSPLGFSILHYIDFETGLETHRSSTIQSEGETYNLDLVYFYMDEEKPYAEEGPRIPSGFLMKVNGKPKYTVKLEKNQINPGLMDMLFAKHTNENFSN